MSSFVQGIGSLFGGNNAAQKAAQQQQELSQIAQARSDQTANDNAATTGGQLAGIKQVRGERLLLSDKSGGLATTLGTA